MRLTGVLHMHSTHSYDGKVSLATLKELLMAEGISFACMSEHTDELTPEGADAFVAECAALSDTQFCFIPGFEVPYKDAHILMLGCTEFYGQVADAAQLRAWREAAQLTLLAHPVRNRFLLDEPMRDVIDGVEIWNQQYDGKRAPRQRAYDLLAKLRTERTGLIATGGLDLHRPEHLTFPRVTLEASSCTQSALMKELQRGRFTFGNTHYTVPAKGEWARAGTLSVRMQSACSICVIGLGKRMNRALAALGLSFPKWLTRAIRSRV